MQTLIDYNDAVKSNEQLVASLVKEVASLKEYIQLSQKVVYTNKEVLELLDINPKTLKKYRDNGWLGSIGYTQYGDKFYYTLDDLMQFIKGEHQEAFALKN